VEKIHKFLGSLTPAQIMVLGFLSLIFLGSLLLSLPTATTGSVDVSYLEALFTATAAVCVTGLVVVDAGTAFSPFGQGVILTLIQIGGLGFMTLSTTLFLMAGKKIGLRDRLLIREAFNQYDISGLVRLVRQVIKTTLFCEGIGAILLTGSFLAFMPFSTALYYGIFHAISAFCNAGFDLFGKISVPSSSLTAYAGEWFTVVIALLVIVGGLGFPVLVELGKHFSGEKLSLHAKMVLFGTATLLICGFFVFFILEHNNPRTLGQKPLFAQILTTFFQTVTPRTAGFNSLPLTALRDPTIFLLIILMFIGASPSSTGGGIKTTTFFTLILAIRAMIRGKSDVELFERRLPTDVVIKSFAIVFISIALVGVVTLCLCWLEPDFSFLALLLEATSAFSTAGMSQGVTPNLTSVTSKLLLIGTMFAGRVGLFTVVVALTRHWQTTEAIRYSEERVIIG
jgi:trk system potassium uptake protein TrkH